jgi:hypothetical protein
VLHSSSLSRCDPAATWSGGPSSSSGFADRASPSPNYYLQQARGLSPRGPNSEVLELNLVVGGRKSSMSPPRVTS